MDDNAAQFQRQLARAIEPYQAMLVELVTDRMSPGDFEMQYMSRWGEGNDAWMPEEIFRVVEDFFFVVEDYVDNPNLRNEIDRSLGPDELKAKARELLQRAGFEPPSSD